MSITKISLPQASWKGLSQLLSQNWSNDPKDIVVAGLMEEKEVIKLDPEPTEPTKEQETAWRDKEVEIEFTLSEAAAIKKCLQFTVAKGVMYCNKYTAKLLQAFDLG